MCMRFGFARRRSERRPESGRKSSTTAPRRYPGVASSSWFPLRFGPNHHGFAGSVAHGGSLLPGTRVQSTGAETASPGCRSDEQSLRRREDRLGSLLAAPLIRWDLRRAAAFVPRCLHKNAICYARRRRQVMASLSQGALTLTHHDHHPGNLFRSDSCPGLLEWPLARVGPASVMSPICSPRACNRRYAGRMRPPCWRDMPRRRPRTAFKTKGSIGCIAGMGPIYRTHSRQWW